MVKQFVVNFKIKMGPRYVNPSNTYITPQKELISHNRFNNGSKGLDCGAGGKPNKVDGLATTAACCSAFVHPARTLQHSVFNSFAARLTLVIYCWQIILQVY